MKKIAIFPGSFDPITVGHFNIIERASLLFDEIVVAIGNNSTKKYMFPLEQRKEWLNQAFSGLKNTEIDTYEGLTYKYCLDRNIPYILRGIRNPSDFEFEKSIAHFNQDLSKSKIETVFLLTEPSLSFISSSNVREIILNKGDFSKYVPSNVFDNIQSFINSQNK